MYIYELKLLIVKVFSCIIYNWYFINLWGNGKQKLQCSFNKLFELQRDFSENRIILICRYLTATAGKSDVKKRKRESCHILTKSPEIQALQGEEISKACEKLQRREELQKNLNKNEDNVKVKFLGR